MAEERKYQIVREIGVINHNRSGWNFELNYVSWNDKEPKYDLRDWNQDHTRMGRGLTLTKEELSKVNSLIENELMDFAIE